MEQVLKDVGQVFGKLEKLKKQADACQDLKSDVFQRNYEQFSKAWDSLQDNKVWLRDC